MASKRDRIDTSGERRPLTDNPFAQLQPENAPPASPARPVDETPAPARNAGYTVNKTRKGGYALRIEKRAAGKVVTILEGVSGDAKALLGQLKKQCGAGGAVRGAALELQGDHRASVETFLRTQG